MRDTLLTSGAGKTATLGALATLTELPGQTRDPARRTCSAMSLSPLDGRHRPGQRDGCRAEGDRRPAPPSSIRVEYGWNLPGTAEILPRPRDGFILAILLVFIVLLFEFEPSRAPGHLGVRLAFDVGRFHRAAGHAHHFQHLVLQWHDHGGRNRRQNGILLWTPTRNSGGLGMSAEDAMLQASRRRLRPIVMTALATVAGMLPLAFAIGRLPDAATAGYLGHRRILISMILSLIITPTVHFYLSHEPAKESGFPPASRT